MGVACRNCGTALAGEYCHACGQRDLPPDPTLRELAGEAWGEFVSVDGKVLNSLRLLVLRPGQLTVECLAGRRTRHLAPLRLYLVCSVAYFLVSSLVPERAPSRAALTVGKDTVVLSSAGPSAKEVAARKLRRDSATRAVLAKHGLAAPAGVFDSATLAVADSFRVEDEMAGMTAAPRWLRSRLAHGINGVIRDKHSFWRRFTDQLPRLLFVLMPAFALLLGLAYRSRQRRYPVHLIVSLHLHSFAFAALTLGALADVVPWGPASKALGIPLLLWEFLYVPLAMRTVYGGRLRGAVARATALAFVYGVIVMLAFFLLGFGLLLAY